MVKAGAYADLIESKRHIGSSDFSPISNRRNSYSMKKYYQAILFAVALLSIVSLLFYRHEYNRLRYVLEVLNFYGKPGAKDADTNSFAGNSGFDKLDLLFDSPLPSWQKLNNDLFIYSAHRIGENKIRAIAFGKTYDNLNMNCNVFFEGRAPVLGTFKHSKISKNLGYSEYQLICEYIGFGIPEGVSFFDGGKSSGNQAAVVNVRNSPQNLMTDGITFCVAPPLNRSISRTDMISFLNFHQIAGVGHFIIYDYGIPSAFTETVRDIIVSRSLNFTFTILPWNLPFAGLPNDITKGIVEKDCLYRNYNKVEYSATLYWEEYMVLKHHHNLLQLLDDFEKITPSSERYLLDTSVFCTQQKDDKEAIVTAPIVFRKTGRVASGSVKTRPVYISKPHKSLHLGNVDATKADADLINVNVYRYCIDSIKEKSYMYDSSILRFAGDMSDALIYKEYIARQSLSIE